MKDYKAKSEKQAELIELYKKELDRTAVYLHVHNMSCGTGIAQESVNLRAELAQIDKEIEAELLTDDMKEKDTLYDQAMALLEGCNDILKDNPALPTINTKLAGVVKDLNDIRIKTLTGIKPEDVK